MRSEADMQRAALASEIDWALQQAAEAAQVAASDAALLAMVRARLMAARLAIDAALAAEEADVLPMAR